MPRRASRSDENQPAIVAALRACGATVTPTHGVCGGFPDLVVGYQGRNFLLEVKDPAKPKGDQKLTPAQIEWHAAWRGQKAVVKTVDEALIAVGAKYA